MGEIIEHEDELQELSLVKRDIVQELESGRQTDLKAVVGDARRISNSSLTMTPIVSAEAAPLGSKRSATRRRRTTAMASA